MMNIKNTLILISCQFFFLPVYFHIQGTTTIIGQGQFFTPQIWVNFDCSDVSCFMDVS